jgi:hypothetical protein
MLMRFFACVAGALIAMAAGSGPAHACYVAAPLRLEDVRSAKTVVIGRISNYEIVRDRSAREERRTFLAGHPDISPEYRKSLEEQDGFLSDYARFDVLVEEVLAGKAPKIIRVTWDNSTFGEPESMPGGKYLVALRDPGSPLPPLRGPSATILPAPEPDTLTVLQAPCAPAFIFKGASAEALAIRRILGK